MCVCVGFLNEHFLIKLPSCNFYLLVILDLRSAYYQSFWFQLLDISFNHVHSRHFHSCSLMKTLLILFNYFCAKKVMIALFVVSMIKSSD